MVMTCGNGGRGGGGEGGGGGGEGEDSFPHFLTFRLRIIKNRK